MLGLKNKIHVQTNMESVQCRCINPKHNKVRITQVSQQLAETKTHMLVHVN